MLPVALTDIDRARSLLQDDDGPGVRDAIHAAVMLNNGISKIATFDRAFDRVPEIQRIRFSP